jgi:hypothetical protein
VLLHRLSLLPRPYYPSCFGICVRPKNAVEESLGPSFALVTMRGFQQGGNLPILGSGEIESMRVHSFHDHPLVKKRDSFLSLVEEYLYIIWIRKSNKSVGCHTHTHIFGIPIYSLITTDHGVASNWRTRWFVSRRG